MIACSRIAIVPVVDVVVVVQVNEPENLEQTEINHNHVITDHMIWLISVSFHWHNRDLNTTMINGLTESPWGFFLLHIIPFGISVIV